MKRKFLGILSILVLSSLISITSVEASSSVFYQHFDAAQEFLNQGQYSSAITEFRKALRINYMDNSARIGLINSYLARATYYANQEKNFDKSANDFRNALFYLQMFPTKDQTIQNSASMIASARENLNQCLRVTSFDMTASSRYKKAEELRASGNLAAAAYEFSQAAKNEKLTSEANANIAVLMKVLGNIPRSAEYYEIALNHRPNDLKLRMEYARTLDKLERYDDALTQYNHLLAGSKGDMETLYALERIYLKKLAQSPSDAELHANIGAIKQAQGDFETALSYYGKAEQINPSNINTRLNVGTLFQQKKDYLKAIKSYDSVLELYPDNAQANLYKAQALSEMGNKKEALKLYQKVLSVDPANHTAKTEITDVMKDALSPEEYIAYLAKNSSDKTMQNLLYNFAIKLHKENKIDTAISAYKNVISANPENVDAYVNLAICYASQNDYKNAEAILNTAKSKFPSNDTVLKALGDVQKDSVNAILAKALNYYENKDYKNAIKQYLTLSPATEESMLGVASSYQALEDYNNAIEYYKKAEEINPKNSEIPYYIGYLYSEQQNWKDAEDYLKKSIVLNPESEAKNLLNYVVQNISLADYNEAINLYEKNNFEAALIKLDSAIKNGTNNAFVYYYRGLILDEQKKYKAAVDDFNKFMSIYTTDDEYSQYVKSRIDELKPFI